MLHKLHKWSLLGLVLLVLASCAPDEPAQRDTEDLPVPRELLAIVIEELRTIETFRMIIEQSGAPYYFGVSLDGGQTVISALMRRAEAQYRAPDILGADTTLRVGGLPPLSVDIFAQGEDQWFRVVGNSWLNYPIAEGFDPGSLMREGSGFSRALTELLDLTYIDTENLIDGTEVHHVRGYASGEVINELLFDLLSLTVERVQVDVYVDVATNLPALLEVEVPDTATEDEPDNTRWRIEVYDVNDAFNQPKPESVTLE